MSLKVQDLCIYNNKQLLLDNLSYELQGGECLGLVGESGSGKSLSALALLGLLPSNLKSTWKTLSFDDIPIPEQSWSRIRGIKVGYIFQDPISALNPVVRLRSQFHSVFTVNSFWKTPEELLQKVGLKDPTRILSSYAFELSGGMAQRVMIALTLAKQPHYLIADEPTTALDVTVQKQVLDLLKQLQMELKIGVLLISHDMGVIYNYTDRMIVLKNGKVQESGLTKDVVRNPQHTYTKDLMDHLPQNIWKKAHQEGKSL